MSFYLSAKFRIHADKVQEFGAVGRRACEIITARAGWQLIAAMTAVTGAQRECTHLWKLPDANAITSLASVLKPEDFETVKAFAACTDGEEYQLLSSLEYDPDLRLK